MPASSRIRALASLLLLVASTGCDGMGGSEYVGHGEPSTFVIAHRSPQGGTAGISLTPTIEITFTSNIDPTSVGSGAVALNGLPYGTTDVDGPTLRFVPAFTLRPDTTYAISLDPDLRGLNGQALGVVQPWGFKTGGTRVIDSTEIYNGPRPR